MYCCLHTALLICSLFLTAPLSADDPAAAETPPTPEEIKAALEKVSQWFNGGPSRPPAAPVKQPEWYPLQPDDSKRVEEVLAAWRASRAKESRLRCQFRQWEYDPAFGPKDQSQPYIYTEGEFRWDAPDIWMWRGTSAKKAISYGSKTEWVDSDPSTCARNKKIYYELDYRRKTRTEHRCEVDLAGNLQFPLLGIFGITLPLQSAMDPLRLDPAEIQDRFWIRPVTPTEGKSERWLELVPKKDSDARRCSSLVVVISESDWEISAMDIRSANYSAKTYPAHVSVEFVNRTRPSEAANVLQRVLGGSDGCIPAVPAGWKKAVQDYRDLRVKK